MLRLWQRGPHDDKQLYANHNRSDSGSHRTVELLWQFCEQYNSQRCASGSCVDGMQVDGEDQERSLMWTGAPVLIRPCAAYIASPSYAPPLLSAHKYCRQYTFNALARPQMMSPVSSAHPCTSALNVFIIGTWNLIKFLIKSVLWCYLYRKCNTSALILFLCWARKSNYNRPVQECMPRQCSCWKNAQFEGTATSLRRCLLMMSSGHLNL